MILQRPHGTLWKKPDSNPEPLLTVSHHISYDRYIQIEAEGIFFVISF